MSDDLSAFRVVVAGGSIGGLCAGLALRGAGCDVDVFEKTPDTMTSRGAGIVVQGDLTGLLNEHRAPALPVTSCRSRLYLQPGGGDGNESAMPQQFTSWEAIYRTLRATFPDERYHMGSTVTDFSQNEAGARVIFDDREALDADLLVCADGSYSRSRRQLLPETAASYAGYVAWRGTLHEKDAPPDLIDFFKDRFTFCDARSGGHILCYFIPGDGATTERGSRRLNWVWYVGVPDGPELRRMLTDREGKHHDSSLSAGMMPKSMVSEIHATAERELHPRFADLVRATADPFIQSIIDITIPRMAFGRVCLTGDAAFVVRPHTAGATAKAAADASALASALRSKPNSVADALSLWERRQLETGRGLTQYGVALGKRWAFAN